MSPRPVADYLDEVNNRVLEGSVKHCRRRRWMIAASIVFYIAFVVAIFVLTSNKGKV